MWDVLVNLKSSKQKLLALFFWAAIAAAAVVLFVYAFPPLVHKVIEPFVESIQKSLSPAAIAFVVVSALGLLPLLFLPASPFIWLAALVLGIPWAILLTVVGSALGMLLPFLVTRHFLQVYLLQRLEKQRAAEAILEVISRAGAFKVIFLLRVGPGPYSLLSYVAAIPKSVSLLTYAVASILGQLPTNVVEVWFGRNLKGIADLLTGKKMDVGQLVYNLASIIASVIIAVGGYIYARQALRKIRDEGWAATTQDVVLAQAAGEAGHTSTFDADARALGAHAGTLHSDARSLCTDSRILGRDPRGSLDRSQLALEVGGLLPDTAQTAYEECCTASQQWKGPSVKRSSWIA